MVGSCESLILSVMNDVPFDHSLDLTSDLECKIQPSLRSAHSFASELYDRLMADNDDKSKNRGEENIDPCNGSIDGVNQPCDDVDVRENKVANSEREPIKRGEEKFAADEVIKHYEEHDDSIYAVEWASDPWIFASLGFESRFVINKVPKAEKFNILF